MCLFPPLIFRVKCSMGSCQGALVVATSLFLFWKVAVRRFIAENSFKLDIDAGDSDEEASTPSDEDETPARETPKPPAVNAVAGETPPPPALGVSCAVDVGASEDGALRGRSPVDADVAGNVPASQQPDAVKISSKGVLRVGRRGGAAAGESVPEPHRKKRKMGGAL